MKWRVVTPLPKVGLLGLSLLLLSTMISTGGADDINTNKGGSSEVITGTARHDNDGSDINLVGIHNIKRYCDDVNGALTDDDGCRKRRRILAAMETDELLKVVDAQMADLLCDTLDSAEDALLLKFWVSETEIVVARFKSYEVWPGTSFSDNIQRKVWTGEVIEGKDVDDIPRSIAMTWSGCNVETFMLKLIIPTHDGSTSALMTVPCGEKLCVLQISREGEDESDGPVGNGLIALPSGSSAPEASAPGEPPVRKRGLLRKSRAAVLDESPPSTTHLSLLPAESATSEQQSERAERAGRKLEVKRRLAVEVEQGVNAAHEGDPDLQAKDQDLGLLKDYLNADPEEAEAFHEQGVRRLDNGEVSMPSGRVLSSDSRIDVMVLYTTKAMIETNNVDGPMRSETQMETDIITAYEGANNALRDSGVDITLNVVHMARIYYDESDEISEAVYDLYGGTGDASGVHELRDTYGADLVQLVGFYLNTCGIGFTMQTPTSAFAKYGYSVVHTNCLSNFSHIHEIGHNLGANHDRHNSDAGHAYAYAYRYCDGNTPYRTIMAYEAGCTAAPRVNVFSTPAKSYANKVQGTETADNARVISEAAIVAANFRETVALVSATETPAASPVLVSVPSSPPVVAPATFQVRTAFPTASPTPQPATAPELPTYAPAAPTPKATPTPQKVVAPRTPSPMGKAQLTARPSATPVASLTPVPTHTTTISPINAAPTTTQAAEGNQKWQSPTTGAAKLTTAPTMAPDSTWTLAPTNPTAGTSIYPDKISEKRMKWKGCFKDNIQDRVMEAGTYMPAIEGVTVGMTRDNCMAYCASKKTSYKFFGVEFASECFCWENNMKFKRLGRLEGSHCDMACSGDPKQTCGGETAIEVFKMKNYDYDENTNVPNYEGCYRDTFFDLELSNQPVLDFMHATHESCNLHCNTAGFAYFALEFGFLCQCGDILPDPSREADDERCKLPCSDPNTRRKCGGDWHMAVFSVGVWVGQEGEGGEEGQQGEENEEPEFTERGIGGRGSSSTEEEREEEEEGGAQGQGKSVPSGEVNTGNSAPSPTPAPVLDGGTEPPVDVNIAALIEEAAGEDPNDNVSSYSSVDDSMHYTDD